MLIAPTCSVSSHQIMRGERRADLGENRLSGDPTGAKETWAPSRRRPDEFDGKYHV